jgi:hypothetical protein
MMACRSSWLCVLAVVAGLPSVAIAQRAAGSSPTCERVARSAPKWSDVALKGLAGEYRFHVIATQGRYSTDSLARGRLSLWVTNSRYAQGPPRPGQLPQTYPVSGATDIPLARLAPVSIAVPLTSRDPAKPGVQLFSGRSMWLGGAMGPEYSILDAGVLFEIDSVAPDGLRGHWVEGGRRALHGQIPAGYFCAFRLGAPST